jgi:hypothetical protein
MDFASALREQIVTRKVRGLRARRLLALIDGPKTRRRERVLTRLERHATAELVSMGRMTAAQAAGAIDWSAIDWNKVFDVILKILLAILPFLL